jgi:hypothetical protein
MAKPALLLSLFMVFWTTLTATVVFTAQQWVPAWQRQQLWDDAKSYVISFLLPPAALILITGLLACLGTTERGKPSRPSDLDRLLEVKRAARWRLRYRMLNLVGPTELAIALSAQPVVTPGPTHEPPQGSALDRLLTVKRVRGWRPTA